MASTSSPAVAGRRMTMGLLAFHGLTQLDLTGPYEVLSRAPNATVLIISCHPGELTVRFVYESIHMCICISDQTSQYKPTKTHRFERSMD